MKNKPYPKWLCLICARKYTTQNIGANGVNTFHLDKCDVCGKRDFVTEPRDYGYPEIPGFKK